MINSYSMQDLKKYLFDGFINYSQLNIIEREEEFKDKISNFHGKIMLSIGENCGPAVKIRELGENRLGAFFFDNIVSPLESTVQLFNNDFKDILSLRNLSISKWENNDSVFNTFYGIYYHHYFYLRGLEKRYSQNEGGKRRIDNQDIPMFLSSVISQFEYLLFKSKYILQSSVNKTLIFRAVNGQPLNNVRYNMLKDSLEKIGAKNYDLIVVYSNGNIENSLHFDEKRHFYIPENNMRWGDVSEWKKLFFEK